MSCFEFVNLSLNPLHYSKYTQWNEVKDDFIQNYFIFGAFVRKSAERVYSPEGEGEGGLGWG